MSVEPLAILGIGLHLPPAVSVRAHAAAHGADVSQYRGWEKACHAGPDEHPSTMAAQALRRAIDEAGLLAGDLRLVVFSGASRDYVPSWSVSTEIMRLCGISDRCVGLDLTAGCLATLAALDLIQGWLAAHGGGCAAVVAAERWTQTIDYSDVTSAGLWAYGDSAGALVLGYGTSKTGVADFVGAEFRSASDNNGHVLVPYGGTRAPQAPPGVDPNRRQVSDRPKQVITDSYRRGYRDALAGLRTRHALEPTRLVCNQMSPQIVGMLAEALEMKGRVIETGPATGHLGGTDVIVGLQQLVDGNQIDGPVLIGASTAYAFGTGFVAAPRRA